ncbi:MAG: choice-of-anchor B domain-containing protein [Flavobacteriales bacterium]|jgi:choice-of-anchor B domain-containing protein
MKVLLGLVFTFPLLVFAHGGGHPTRYVAPDGQDLGECQKPAEPCASISYAVDKSQKGDQVLVASGHYVLEELDVFYLLSGMIKIRGGYSLTDSYKVLDINKNQTRIEGIPSEYREQLAERGFQLIQDRKGVERELGGKEREWLDLYKNLTSKPSGPSACINGRAEDNDCRNIDRVSHVPLNELAGSPSSANDIWGFVDLNNDKEYALIGLQNGTAVVDVSNPGAPVQVGSVSGIGSTWRDIKVYQYLDEAEGEYKAYAYVTTEASQGLQILDLNDLPNSVSLAATYNSDFVSAHNVSIANVDYASGLVLPGQQAFLYISGSNAGGGGFRSYGLTDPLNPTLLPGSSLSTYVHDLATFLIDDARTQDCSPGHDPCEILIDFNENTIDIWDVTNKSSRLMISSTEYSNSGYVHSGWYSDDKQTIFVQDELDEVRFAVNTTMRAMSISDLKNPTFESSYVGPTQAIDHNGFTKGDYYYMSNYRRGLTVIDVSDPSDMTEVAYFDTFAVPSDNSASFNGAWGVYPFLPSGNILVSDIEYGLWVLKLNESDDPIDPPVNDPIDPPVNDPIDPPVNDPIDPPSLNPSGAQSGGGGSFGGGLIYCFLLVLLFRRRIVLTMDV